MNYFILYFLLLVGIFQITRFFVWMKKSFTGDHFYLLGVHALLLADVLFAIGSGQDLVGRHFFYATPVVFVILAFVKKGKVIWGELQKRTLQRSLLIIFTLQLLHFVSSAFLGEVVLAVIDMIQRLFIYNLLGFYSFKLFTKSWRRYESI